MRPAAELLEIEAQILPGLLAHQPTEAFARPTVLPGWSVRDVVAHCAAALGMLVRGEDLVFTPEANQAAVDERAAWPLDRVLAELGDAYAPAVEAIERAGGAADGLALGEWIHGGDIRDALGLADAYASRGIDLAIPLLVDRSTHRDAPGVLVEIDGQNYEFGTGSDGWMLRTDAATFVRLCGGRDPDPARYELVGLTPRSLVLFS